MNVAEGTIEIRKRQFVFYTPIFVYSLLISDSRSGGFNFEGLKPGRRRKKLALVRHIIAVDTLEYFSQVFEIFLIRWWQLRNHLLNLTVTEGDVINHGIMSTYLQ